MASGVQVKVQFERPTPGKRGLLFEGVVDKNSTNKSGNASHGNEAKMWRPQQRVTG